jgi:hypothetical protein
MKTFFTALFLKLFCAGIVVSAPVISFTELITRAEKDPVIVQRAAELALRQGLPVSILTATKVYYTALGVESGKVVYAVYMNLADIYDGGYSAYYEDISGLYNPAASRIDYGNGMIVDKSGNNTGKPFRKKSVNERYLMIPNWTYDRVYLFSSQNGDLLDTAFIPRTNPQLQSPKHAIQMFDQSSVIVSDQISDLVQKFNTNGSYAGHFAPSGGVNTSILDNIRGMAYMNNQNLLVTVGSGASQNTIQQFNTNGDPLGPFINTNLSSPFGIIMRTEDILVSNSSGTNKINRYDTSGSFIAPFYNGTGLNFPQQIIRLSDGRIAVAGFSSPSGVIILDSAGNYIRRLAGVSGNRGVYLLGNGNYLTTSGTGVFELDSTSGSVVRTIISGFDFHYIDILEQASEEADLDFYQVDFNMNGQTETDSDWGVVSVSSNGYQGLKYFNLSIMTAGIDTMWQVQNAILSNTENYGTPQSLTFAFDIGVKGSQVGSIMYGYTITDQPAISPPLITDTQFVQNVNYEVYDGFPFFNTNSEGLEMPEAQPFENTGNVKDSASHSVSGMPNQDCGTNECAPAGISNSLNFLRKAHNMSFDSAYASIDSMRKATGFSDNTMTADNYYLKKDEYLKKNNIPITTRLKSKDDIYGLQKELDNNQDIEMFVWWYTIDTANADTSSGSHVVTVTSITKLGGGKYQITAQDDRDQGTSGGTTSETITYDSVTNSFTSGTYTAYNMGIYHFIIECPNLLTTQQVDPPDQSTGVNPGSPMKWTKSPGAASYWLEVSLDPLFQTHVINNFTVPDSFYLPAQNELLPNATYYWRVRVNDSAGSGSYASVFQFTTGTEKTLTIFALLQGMYDSQTGIMVTDTMNVELRETSPPYNIVETSTAVMSQGGTGQFKFYNVSEGVPYYIVLDHRNCVLTYSSSGVQFSSGSASYNFMSSAAQAYGSNMILVDTSPNKYAIYSGDVNKDGAVDATDLAAIDNDAFNFNSGYLATDVTGDGFVDATDYSIADNNAANFVSAILP